MRRKRRMGGGVCYILRKSFIGLQTLGGCLLTKACWDEAWLYNDTDRALVRDGNVYALLHVRSGDLIRLNCDCVDIYGDTLLRICRNGKYGLVDFDGDEVVSLKYDVLTNYHTQFNFIGRRSRYGLLNLRGEWVQPLLYDVIFHINQRGDDRLVCIRRHKAIFL